MRRMRAQRGVALLALVAVLTLGVSWYLISALNTATRNATAQQQHDALVMRQAKEALIGWVARQALDATEAHPGRLPCPESLTAIGTSEEGTASSNCALPAAGRLPWKTLGLEQLTDSAGEPLWYAVSAGWASYSAATLVLNSNTRGSLTVDGLANAAAALVISPGAALPVPASANCAARAQSRSTAALNVLDYLECQNAVPANGSFVSTGPSGSFNDRIVTVTAKDIWSVVEGVVAKRIERDVVPQLQAALYNTSVWGGSATAPIYPYPARFSNDAATTFNPETFQGRRYSNDANSSGNLRQGLLPVSASTCTTLTAARCDASFVQWRTSTLNVSKTTAGGPSWSYDCSASSSSVIRCVIDYSCGGFCLGSMGLRVRVEALNVGMALRTLDATQVSGLSSVTVPSATIAANGTADTDVRGTLGYYCPFGGCSRPAATTITIPIGLFADAAFITPGSGDAWYWFFSNDWHLLTYYAVAPAQLPSGSHNCSSSGPCITVNVTGGAALNNRQAVLVLAGRSLTGSTRPNATLADFLDIAENTDGNTTFQQNRANSAFNDRIVSVANY